MPAIIFHIPTIADMQYHGGFILVADEGEIPTITFFFDKNDALALLHEHCDRKTDGGEEFYRGCLSEVRESQGFPVTGSAPRVSIDGLLAGHIGADIDAYFTHEEEGRPQPSIEKLFHVQCFGSDETQGGFPFGIIRSVQEDGQASVFIFFSCMDAWNFFRELSQHDREEIGEKSVARFLTEGGVPNRSDLASIDITGDTAMVLIKGFVTLEIEFEYMDAATAEA